MVGPAYQNASNSVFVSNISLTDNGKNYYGSYINDDWKVSPKLTVNLGLRWDFFGLVFEHHGAQANFVPSGPPTGSPLYLLPSGANASNFSPSFTSLLATDGITPVIGNTYGKGLGRSQKANFAPRVGFAYQVSTKLVARGGFGIFYNGFENRGFSPNLGENYPFQFNFQFAPANDNTPITYPGCTSPSATPIGSATLETGFTCTPLSPTLVNASGLALRGIQFDYQTPYSMGGNFTVQYQLTPSMSVQAGYVTSLARHLEVFPELQQRHLDRAHGLAGRAVGQHVPSIPGFRVGRKLRYHQRKQLVPCAADQGGKAICQRLEFPGHLYLVQDARRTPATCLTEEVLQGFRAPDVPGAGIHYDYGLASFDIRNVFHFSGGYELPFGKGKRFMSDGGRASNALVGGWSVNWSATLQGGQPITLPCPSGTAARDRLLRPRGQGTKPEAWTAHRLAGKAELVRESGSISASPAS